MKKAFRQAVILLLIVAIAMSMNVLSSAVSFRSGDVNGDGKITASDARAALRISASLMTPDESERLAADVTGDGKITASDARKILRVSAGLDKFSVSSGSSSLVNNPYGTVYISVKSGSKYHRDDCRTIKDSTVICVTVEDAEFYGYSACKVCDP